MTRPPLAAALLGAAGLLPAIAAAVVVAFGPGEWREAAAALASTYSALILSFLGGMWWGLACVGPPALRTRALMLAVLPSLAAWPALVLDRTPALLVLGALLVAVMPADLWLVRVGLAPPWWLRLRVPLSLALAAATLVGGVSLLARPG